MGKWTLSEPPWWGPTPEGRGSGAGVPCPVLTWRWMQEEADRKSSDRELPGRRGWWTRDRTERWVGAPGRSQSERRAQESPGHAASDMLPALPSSAAWPTWPPDKASRATSSSTPPTCCSSISECPSPPSTWPCGLSTLPGAPPSLRGPPSALPAAPQPFRSLTQVKEADCRAFIRRAAQGDTELLANLPNQRTALRHRALVCLVGAVG